MDSGEALLSMRREWRVLPLTCVHGMHEVSGNVMRFTMDTLLISGGVVGVGTDGADIFARLASDDIRTFAAFATTPLAVLRTCEW